jgi:formylglycine-generating enzyme
MGADQSYPEEAPVHTVAVGDFWIDAHTVTNAEFAAFVAATGYETVAERPLDPDLYPGAQPELLKPGAAVFFMPAGPVDMNEIHSRWAYVPGANWHHPEGPTSTIEGREREPVVQVAFEDAAAWAGKEVPTKAEGNLPPRRLGQYVFSWGNEFTPGGCYMANTARRR